MGRPYNFGLGRKGNIRFHDAERTMTSHVALIGAALISLYMGASSAWRFAYIAVHQGETEAVR